MKSSLLYILLIFAGNYTLSRFRGDSSSLKKSLGNLRLAPAVRILLLASECDFLSVWLLQISLVIKWFLIEGFLDPSDILGRMIF